MRRWKNWIDGKWTDSAAREMTRIENPATRDTIAEVPNSTPEGGDRAVQAAQSRFYAGRWTGVLRGERQRMLWRLGELVEQKAEELARVEWEKTGKPFKYLSLGIDLPAAIDHLRFFAACARDT